MSAVLDRPRTKKKTGKTATLHHANVFKLEGGKVKEHWIFGDGMAMAKQLELTPPPGQAKPAGEKAAEGKGAAKKEEKPAEGKGAEKKEEKAAEGKGAEKKEEKAAEGKGADKGAKK